MKNRSISFYLYRRILLISKIQSILSHIKLIHQIALGLVLGILLAVTLPQSVPFLTVFGDLFVKALKSVAPVLVFFLVINAIAQKKPNQKGSMKPIVTLYMTSTFLASIIGVSFPSFPHHPHPAGRCRCRQHHAAQRHRGSALQPGDEHH